MFIEKETTQSVYTFHAIVGWRFGLGFSVHFCPVVLIHTDLVGPEAGAQIDIGPFTLAVSWYKNRRHGALRQAA